MRARFASSLRAARVAARAAAVAGVVGLLGACNNPVYMGEIRPLGTTANMMAGQMGFTPDSDLFVIPVRHPTMKESMDLAAEQQRLGLPMPVPWAALRDFDIQVDWTIKNLENGPVKAFFQINGGTEFGDYDPTQFVDPTAPMADQVAPPPLLGGTPITLEANATYTSLFREDELAESGRRLEAITRYPDPANVMSTPFKVLTHRSTASNLGYENVPAGDVTPAMVRLALTLAADGQVALDYTVRVRDHHDKLLHPVVPNSPMGYVSTAGTLAPPVAPPGAP